MLLSGIVVLAAFCGFAAGVGNTIVNVEKAEVKIAENNGIMGPWSISITPAKPMNKVTIKIPVLSELTESNMMLTFKGSMEGTALPEYVATVCESLHEEIVGKALVAAGNPFPDKCPMAKGDYEIREFVPNAEKFPQGLPDGKLLGTLEIHEPGKKAVVTINFEALISHAMLG